MPPRRPEFRWDRARGQFRDARTGRYVSHAQVRAWLDTALESRGARIEVFAQALRSGSLDLISWEVAMRREVKNVALYSAAAVKGGWAQLSDADLGRVGQFVRTQYEFLRRFAQEVQDGTQRRDGRLNTRASLYGESGRVLYHRMEIAEQVVRGMTEKHNVRGATDSCDGCVAATAAGWHPIGSTSVPEIGARDCRTRCRCSWAYRAGEVA